MQRTLLLFGLASLLLGCASPGKHELTFKRLPTDYDPTERFSRTELRRLARAYPENKRRLFWLINRAAAGKDASFRHLLSDARLMQDPALSLALAGYRYAIEGDAGSLDYILKTDAALPRGGDHNTIVVMSYMDEWDRTLKAIRSHEKSADGAGSIAITVFYMTRLHFYPAKQISWPGVDLALGKTRALMAGGTRLPAP